eukprot:4666065-Amphidinium_carterae.1
MSWLEYMSTCASCCTMVGDCCRVLLPTSFAHHVIIQDRKRAQTSTFLEFVSGTFVKNNKHESRPQMPPETPAREVSWWSQASPCTGEMLEMQTSRSVRERSA